MAEVTPGSILRDLQQVQGLMKKARQALAQARGGSAESREKAFRVGWESLARTHRVLAAIPAAAATEPVLTRQLAVQRYATALLVRLRRLVRNEAGPETDRDDEFEDRDA